MKIGIIDYGMGNLGSVRNACSFLEFSAEIITAPEGLDTCDAIILPGVGAFGDCMQHLRDHGFVEPLKQWIADDRPFLGICVGLQVMFEGSEESPDQPGLGVFPGTVRRFQVPAELKVPQIGWNAVRAQGAECPLFAGIDDGSYFYFVHSFYVAPTDESLVAAVTDYGRDYASVCCRGSVMAVQFHPEKSQSVGLRMLKNFHSFASERVSNHA